MKAAFPELPDEADNDVREDGTAAHWLANEIWNGRFPAVDSMSPNNRILTEDMFDHVDEYHDALRSHPGVQMILEQTIALDAIYKGMTGTPDAYGWDAVNRILYIFDLKYGFRFVEVWYNWQMLCYAAGLLEMLRIDGLQDQYTTIVFTIFQPRSTHRDGPLRTWRVRASDLRASFNYLRTAAAEVMKDDPLCTPNPGCKDCAGRHGCQALQNSALSAVEVAYSSTPLEMSPADIGSELRLLKEAQGRLEGRITGLQVQAEIMLRAGKIVPHWTLAPSYARERWREGTESQVMSLGALYNVSLARPAKPITPNQARKLIPSTLVAPFAHKPSTGVTLTRQDPLEAKKAFSSTQE